MDFEIEELRGLAMDADFQAPRLAKKLGLTTRTLQRRTRQLFGRSPQEWLDEQRMILAAHVLKEFGSAKGTSIGLGFKQVSHFSRCFKMHHGISASEYLAKHGRVPPAAPERKPA